MNRPRSQKQTPQNQNPQNKNGSGPLYNNISGPGGRQGLESAPDTAAYQRRSDQIEQIETMFGEFGLIICSHILTQSLMPGGIKRLTIKLEISSRGRDGADLAMVCKWIENHGVDAFCKKVGLRTSTTLNLPIPPPIPPKDDRSSALRVVPLGGKPKQETTSPQLTLSARSLADPPSSGYKQKVPSPPMEAKNLPPMPPDDEGPVTEKKKTEKPIEQPAAGPSGFMFSPRKK
jgi:hypothetical protein